MYKDDAEATSWRASALERERDELKVKLRTQEEKLERQTQEIDALRNPKSTPQVESPPPAQARAIVGTCTTCGGAIEQGDEETLIMYEAYTYLYHRSCWPQPSPPSYTPVSSSPPSGRTIGETLLRFLGFMVFIGPLVLFFGVAGISLMSKGWYGGAFFFLSTSIGFTAYSMYKIFCDDSW